MEVEIGIYKEELRLGWVDDCARTRGRERMRMHG